VAPEPDLGGGQRVVDGHHPALDFAAPASVNQRRRTAALVRWSAGSSGGWGEACGYRWITMQVRVRVTPSTTWMRETTSRPS
jgi:hypothetical protein